jgi:acyl-CoA reductase-like NAD-dependent aldehyde dehydrogenase
VNPVSSPHFNFTIPEPTGVVTVIAPDEPPLLAMVSLLAPVILTGNSAIVIASEKHALPALTFAEIVATSDILSGVVNVLAGKRKELAPHIAGHFDVNAIIDGSGDDGGVLAGGTAINLKRYAARTLAAREWFTRKAEDPYWILDTVEFKTAWHPIGL